jgi:quinol monooxygenase YgiN
MATLIVKHRVSNFENWKVVFDEMGALRAKHGWISHRVLRDAVDPNVVTIINRVKDLASAKQYGQSPELREAMQRGGIQGAPEISLLDDTDERTY